MKTNGCILWQGNSLLNQAPIVVILTGITTPSDNRKTGAMIQSWVIGQANLPTEATLSGADAAVCGNCPLRQKICYVNVVPVNAIWQKYQSDGYPPINKEILDRIRIHQMRLRITSYGDAGATPYEAWESLLEVVGGNTGYTHQWRTCDRRWQRHLMASVETRADVAIANQQGWRTFRVAAADEPLLDSEQLCKHTENDGITCVKCGLCNGQRPMNVVDRVHGLNWKRSNFRELIIH